MLQHRRPDGVTGPSDRQAVDKGRVILKLRRGLGRYHVDTPSGEAVVSLRNGVAPPKALVVHARGEGIIQVKR